MQTATVTTEPAVSRLRLAFAGLALVFLLGPLVASAPLVDPDEGLHAAIAQEMVSRHDYVTPTFLGEPFLDKPILFFWAEALSLRVFGDNETAIRIPPLLFGLLGMLSVTLLARELVGDVASLIAGIVYASMLLPLGVSEVAVHDVGLVPFMCAAAVCLLRAARSRRAWAWGLPMGVCLGLSILTKGLVGLVFVGILAVCVSAARRDALLHIAIAFTVAVAIAIAVAAPWYLAMERAHPGYLHYYFVERHLRGYLTASQRHAGRPWWYYLPILAGGTLPWTGYLVGAARALRDDPMKVRDRLVVWGWCAIGLVFLSAGESKLATYALPIFPGLALLIGDYISSAWHRQSNDRLFRAGLAIQVITLAALPALAAAVLQAQFHAGAPFVWVAAVVAIPLVLDLGARAWRAMTLDRFVAHTARAISMSFLVLAMVIAPRVARWMTARDLAAALNQSGRLPSRVAVLDERIGSLIFYLTPSLRAEATPARVTTTTRSAAIERLRVDPPDAVLAVRDDELPRFQRLFPAPPVADVRAGTFTVYRVDRLRAALESQR